LTFFLLTAISILPFASVIHIIYDYFLNALDAAEFKQQQYHPVATVCNFLIISHHSVITQIIQLQDVPYNQQTPGAYDRKYYEPIGQWKRFADVCTTPVEPDEDSSIVMKLYHLRTKSRVIYGS
jgi:hypothetical protein